MHARHYVISAQVTCASCTGSSGNREGSGRCQDLRRRPLEAHTLPLQVLAAGIRQQLEVRQQHAMSGKCETFKGSGSPRAAAPAPAPLRGCRGCFRGAWASASSSSTEAMGSRDAGPARRSRERSRGGRARYRWWVIVKPAGSPQRAHCCVSLEFSRRRAPPLLTPHQRSRKSAFAFWAFAGPCARWVQELAEVHQLSFPGGRGYVEPEARLRAVRKGRGKRGHSPSPPCRDTRANTSVARRAVSERRAALRSLSEAETGVSTKRSFFKMRDSSGVHLLTRRNRSLEATVRIPPASI